MLIVKGFLEISKSSHANVLIVKGFLEISKSLHANVLIVKGFLEISKSSHANVLIVKGFLEISKSLHANVLIAKGFQVSADHSGETLDEIRKLIEADKVRPVVGQVLQLEDVKDGHEISQTGHAQGKIVLTI